MTLHEIFPVKKLGEEWLVAGQVTATYEKQAPGLFRPNLKLTSGFVSLALNMQIKMVMQNISNLSNLKEEYEQRINEFIALATHDLDSPLRKLGVFVERLTETFPPNDPQASIYIQRINSCLNEMRSIVTSLSELKAIGLPKRYVSCNLAAILEQVQQDLGSQIETTGAVLKVSSLPELTFDPDQCYLLFRKLLENSLKFTLPGQEAEISISAESGDTTKMKEWGLSIDGGGYKLVIEDNGSGFDMEDAEKIFDHFQRLHGKSAYPGSGLGLTIARKIVENHRGKIFAESKEGKGSRFILLLPKNQD